MAKNGNIGGGGFRSGFGGGGHGGFRGRGQMMGMMGMPNTHAAELSAMASYRSLSKGLTNVFENLRRVQQQARQVGEIYNRSISRKAIGNYGGLTGSLGNMIGMMKGPTGTSLDITINKFLQKVRSAGGVNIRAGDLTKEIANLKSEIAQLASSTRVFDATILKDMVGKLGRLEAQASKGGVGGIGGGVRGLLGTGFGVRAAGMFESQTKKVEGSISNFGKWVSDRRIKKSLEDIGIEFEKASSSAKSSYQKFRAIAEARDKVRELAGSATGNDKTLIGRLSNVMDRNVRETKKGLLLNIAGRGGSSFNNRLLSVTQAIGSTFSYLRPLKRTFDTANTVFQQLNNGFNRFARLQMSVTGERGAYGRRMRGAGMDFGAMMGALSAGRKAGMDDRQVINQMVSLQTQLAQARWGEGGLIDAAGRWGISVYDEAGQVKQWDVFTAEVSKMANTMHDAQERLQFITHLGYRPEQMEYVLGFAKERQRMEFLKKNPHLQGTLDRANILDQEGWRAKADAYTKIELKRRQILNENAIEEGIGPALKRAFNPENWLLNDWTARQTGVRQAKGEQALEKLENAIRDNIDAIERNGPQSALALAGLNLSDLASIAEVAKADIKDKGQNSAFSILNTAYKNSFGIAFDTRSSIEKLQDALIPLTDKIATGVDKAIELLSKLVELIAKSPKLAGAAAIGGTALAFLGMRRLRGAAAIGRITKGVEAALSNRGLGAALGEAGASGGAAAAGGAGIAGTAAAAGGGAGLAATAATVAGTIAASRGARGAASVGRMGITARSGAPAAAQILSRRDSSGVWHISSPTTSWDEAVREVNGLPPSGQTNRITGFNQVAGTSKAARRMGAKAKIAKKGLGRLGIAGDVLIAGFAAKEAYDSYSEGDTAGGNRAIGGAAGGILGGLGGAKLGALIGGAIGTAILPGIGTAIGAAIGGAAGGIGGFAAGGYIGEKGADALSDGMGVQGSSKYNRRHAKPYQERTMEEARQEGQRFIKELRECLNKNETSKAMQILQSKGLYLNASALRNSEFMTSDTKANEILEGAKYARYLSTISAYTGKAASMDSLKAALSNDKIIQSAVQNGIKFGDLDVASAYARQNGLDAGGAATSRHVIRNYIRDGWKGEVQAIQDKKAEIIRNNPTITDKEATAQAEEFVMNKHYGSINGDEVKMLGQADKKAVEAALEYKRIEEEYKKNFGYGPNGKRYDPKTGREVNAKGFIKGTKKRASGVAGLDIAPALAKLSEIRADMAARNPGMGKFANKTIGELDDMNNMSESDWNKYSVEEFKKLTGKVRISPKLRWQMMSDDEKTQEVERLLTLTDEGKSLGAKVDALAEYNDAGITKDEIRNAMRGMKNLHGYSIDDIQNEAAKGSKGRAEKRAREKAEKNARNDYKYELLAAEATDDEITESLGAEKAERYKELSGKKKKDLTGKQATALLQMKLKIGKMIELRREHGKLGNLASTPWDTYDRGGELSRTKTKKSKGFDVLTEGVRPDGGIGAGELGRVEDLSMETDDIWGGVKGGRGSTRRGGGGTLGQQIMLGEQIRLEGKGPRDLFSTYKFGDTTRKNRATGSYTGELGGDNAPANGIWTTQAWNAYKEYTYRQRDNEDRSRNNAITKAYFGDAADKNGGLISREAYEKKQKDRLLAAGMKETDAGFKEALAGRMDSYDKYAKRFNKKAGSPKEVLDKAKSAEQAATAMNANAAEGAAAAASGASANGVVKTGDEVTNNNVGGIKVEVVINGPADQGTVDTLSKALNTAMHEWEGKLIAAYNITAKDSATRP